VTATGDEIDQVQLYLSAIEFCFDTQASGLEVPYDLKIAQCIIAMHQFMQIEIFNIRE